MQTKIQCKQFNAEQLLSIGFQVKCQHVAAESSIVDTRLLAGEPVVPFWRL
jgi:hypothetical protein